MSRVVNLLFEILFLLLVVLCMLSIGEDMPGHIPVRIGLCLFCAFIYAIGIRKAAPLSLAIPTFALFILYEIFRAGRALWLIHNAGSPSPGIILSHHLYAPVWWGVPAAGFVLAYSYFDQKPKAEHLFKTLAFTAFFMAMNAIPVRLIKGGGQFIDGNFGYAINGEPIAFFHPFFYFHKAVYEYILAMWFKSNGAGDVMAFGFFPALALALYGLLRLREKNHEEGREGGGKLTALFSEPGILFLLTISMAIVVAIFSMFSRGTMVCFVLSFLFCFFAFLIKYPSQAKVTVLIAVLIVGGLGVAGSWKRVWKEVQTLKNEKEALKIEAVDAVYRSKSIYYNREGIKRAQKMLKDYPVWGVGTRAYAELSDRYATPGIKVFYGEIATYFVYCHYVQILVEEGPAGAALYGLFLLTYFLQVGWKLLKTKSQFKFLMALSLFAPVIMVLGHSAISSLLDRFVFSLLLHIVMGASLGLLREDFQHR